MKRLISLEIENFHGKFWRLHRVQDHVEVVYRLESSDVLKVMEEMIEKWRQLIALDLHRLLAGEDVAECPAIPDGERLHGDPVQFVDPHNEQGLLDVFKIMQKE